MNDDADVAWLCEASDRWTNWLLGAAMPLWAGLGVDPVNGGFQEAIDVDGRQALAIPRRGRVQPRQIYSVIEAGRLGWTGDWEGIANRALDWYLGRFRLNDGTFADLVAPDGALLESRFDLYNQAFALFGLAHAAAALPERRADLEAIAITLLDRLETQYRHPQAGFEESVPASEPLRANPHMHLLEAALFWERIGGGARWSALADGIMELALARFIDPTTGALREYFTRDWRPMPDDRGRQIEPGHLFEWAWLALRWAKKRNRADATTAARRLFDVGEARGICPTRKVAVLEVNDDFSPRAPVARLWGQTEWIKAALALALVSSGTERRHYLSSARQAVAALEMFLVDDPVGLWRDKLGEDGRFVAEPAPASSLYHIVCAISELQHVRHCTWPDASR
ncbi:AGE family epimerase/isomerase [Stappia sp. ES.058]|uniref:AGE family epimerase/isomerase n=1 Tax=Stappia sp. ES.058 TaxID=1881061 RepID=UPI00087BE6DF|nr:AGE family epimerase/isomerase [Stappia sp. ES.058]SDT94909.1 mannose-6-phosphate isomerase, type 3 [Stappia sp. ES.058]